MALERFHFKGEDGKDYEFPKFKGIKRKYLREYAELSASGHQDPDAMLLVSILGEDDKNFKAWEDMSIEGSTEVIHKWIGEASSNAPKGK